MTATAKAKKPIGSRGWFADFKSSNVHSFTYYPRERRLVVRFLDKNAKRKSAGRTYEYRDVDETLWWAMRRCLSKGRFVWRRLRGKYPYAEL